MRLKLYVYIFVPDKLLGRLLLIKVSAREEETATEEVAIWNKRFNRLLEK